MDETAMVRPARDPAVAAEVRRRIIDIAKRRARPGSGSSIEFLMARTWRDPDLDLSEFRTPFVIVGGVATALYMPLRVTQDLDLLVTDDDAPDLHAELMSAGCRRVGTLAIGGTMWRTPTDEGLDVLESDAAWVEEATYHPNRSPTGLPVIALPYFVLMKFESSRPQDIADLARMLGPADEATLDQVRAVMRTYRPDGLDDIESLIALGKIELEGPLTDPPDRQE